jgi:RNA polymerase-binding transcription factor DksA
VIPFDDGSATSPSGPPGRLAPDRHPTAAADDAYLSEVAAQLDAVEAALDRLDREGFDSCQVCGAPIGHDRLQADPLLSRCPAHSWTG